MTSLKNKKTGGLAIALKSLCLCALLVLGTLSSSFGQDTIPPTVTLNGRAIDSVLVFNHYYDPGVTYSDNHDSVSELTLTKSGTFISTFGTSNPNITGNAYTIIYTVTDKSGNSTNVTRIVEVVDRTPPVIALKGPQTVSICPSGSYNDSGYSVSDNYDAFHNIQIDTLGTFWMAYYGFARVTPKPGLYSIWYSATDKSGNTSYSSKRYVLVKSSNDLSCGSSTNTSIDTLVCRGGCADITSHISGSKYIWSTGDTTRTIRFCPTADTAIDVTIINGTDTTAYIYGITVSASTCVWPGDANKDGVADKNDILSIGIAYGKKGYPRPGASLTWVGQPSRDWRDSFATGGDFKYADCNGDSIIDSTDMAAVTANYGYTHSKAPAMNGSPSDPPFSVALSKDSANAGDTLSAALTLGTASNQVTNAYGLAFSIKYSTMYVKAGSMKADFSNCWLGTAGKDLLTFVYNDSANNSLEIAITRTDHKEISGYGALGSVRIVMQDNVGGKNANHAKVYFTLADVNLIDFNESPKPLFAKADSVKYSYAHLAGINNISLLNNQIQLYPNPATQNLTIDAGSEMISQVTIINIMGKEVYSMKTTGASKMEIPVAQLPSGIYSIRLMTKNGTTIQTFVKQ